MKDLFLGSIYWVPGVTIFLNFNLHICVVFREIRFMNYFKWREHARNA